MNTHKHIQKLLQLSILHSHLACGRYAYNKMTMIPQNSNHPFPLPSVALIHPKTTKNIISGHLIYKTVA